MVAPSYAMLWLHGLATESVVLPASRLSFMAFSIQGLQARLLKACLF